MKKGFSIIEIIFVLLIIAVIITTAVTKFGTALSSTNLLQIKSDVLQIRAGIQRYTNKMILKNDNSSLTTLDDNEKFLFNLILDEPIIASDNSKANEWSKISSTTYKVFVNDTTQITFNYNNTNHTFDCDILNPSCKELDI